MKTLFAFNENFVLSTVLTAEELVLVKGGVSFTYGPGQEDTYWEDEYNKPDKK